MALVNNLMVEVFVEILAISDFVSEPSLLDAVVHAVYMPCTC
jgi:hypothetical protein